MSKRVNILSCWKYIVLLDLFLFAFIAAGLLIIVGISLEIYSLQDSMSLLNLLIACLVAYIAYITQRVLDAEVLILEEKIEAELFPIFDNNLFIRGKMVTSPIFYNKGGKMSIIILDEVIIPNLKCKKIISSDPETLVILPNSHLLIKFEAQFKIENEPVNEQSILSIKNIELKYRWVKNEKFQPSSGKIPISLKLPKFEIKTVINSS